MRVSRSGRSLVVTEISEEDWKFYLRPLGFKQSDTYSTRYNKAYSCIYNEDILRTIEELGSYTQAEHNEYYPPIITEDGSAIERPKVHVEIDQSLSALMPVKNPLKNLRRMKLPSLRPPLTNQLVGNGLLIDNDRYALFWQMGAGKSKPVVDTAGHLINTKQVDFCLIITEINVVSTWCERHVPLDCAYGYKAMPILGSKKEREMRFQRGLLMNDVKFFVLNYDGVRPMKEFLIDHMSESRWIVVLDESQKVKDSRTARFKAIFELLETAGVEIRWLLSGTPVTQNLEDIFGQYATMDYSIFGKNLANFQSEYVNYQTIPGGGRQITGYRNVGRYMAKLHSHCHRLLRSDVVDLPPKTYEVMKFPLPERLSKVYELFKSTHGMLLRPEDIDNKSSSDVIPLMIVEHPLAVLAKARQIVNNWVYLTPDAWNFESEENSTREVVTIDTEYDVVDNPKLQFICDVAEETGKSIIIWYAHHADAVMIERALLARGLTYTTITSKTPKEEYLPRIDMFENHDVQVFLGTPNKVGSGITLLAAEIVFYYNNVFSVERRLQSEDRCHRIGTVHPVTYYDLVWEKTVEVSMKRALEEKIEISKAVVDRSNLGALLSGDFGLAL